MTPPLPCTPSWSEQTGSCASNWTRGNHLGGTRLSSLRKAAHSGCIRCKLLFSGIEKYTFPPYRPYRTTEAPLSEFEPDPGLDVYVINDREMGLRVTVQCAGMSSKSRSLPMELIFYTHPGASAIATERTSKSSADDTQTSHNAFQMFNQQATFPPTLLPKLATPLSGPGSANATLCTRIVRLRKTDGLCQPGSFLLTHSQRISNCAARRTYRQTPATLP
jgi:hypothetical protein